MISFDTSTVRSVKTEPSLQEDNSNTTKFPVNSGKKDTEAEIVNTMSGLESRLTRGKASPNPRKRATPDRSEGDPLTGSSLSPENSSPIAHKLRRVDQCPKQSTVHHEKGDLPPLIAAVDVGLGHPPTWYQHGDPSSLLEASVHKAVLECLEPKKQLNGTAIVLLLEILAGNDETVAVVDPASYLIRNETPPSIKVGKTERKPTQLYMPLHHEKRGHWTLAYVDVPNRTIYYYDSLSSQPEREGIESLRSMLISSCKMYTNEEASWSINEGEIPCQPNTFDCGIYIIVKAAVLIHHLSLGQHIDGTMWRTAFRTMVLSDKRVLNRNLSLQDMQKEETAYPDTPNDNQDITEAVDLHIERLKHVTRRLEARGRQSEQCELVHELMSRATEKLNLQHVDLQRQVTERKNEVDIKAEFLKRLAQFVRTDCRASKWSLRKELVKGQKTQDQSINVLQKMSHEMKALQQGMKLASKMRKHASDLEIAGQTDRTLVVNDYRKQMETLQREAARMEETYKSSQAMFGRFNGLQGQDSVIELELDVSNDSKVPNA